MIKLTDITMQNRKSDKLFISGFLKFYTLLKIFDYSLYLVPKKIYGINRGINIIN